MSDQDLVAYWSRAGTGMGRFRLRLRVARKRLLWAFAVDGARATKRFLDVVVSACALVLLGPVFVITAIFIKMEDHGPIFFRQERVGRRGRLFGMWKFRSMLVDADKLKEKLLKNNEMPGGVTFKMKRDPRVTYVGRFIRKYSIDELPQFWNVLCGAMSLVGPRPALPREVAMYTVDDRQRLLAKPGLTCFWQVAGRSAIDFSGQVQLDVAYIQSESVWLDMKLLFQTVPAVLLGRGAF